MYRKLAELSALQHTFSPSQRPKERKTLKKRKMPSRRRLVEQSFLGGDEGNSFTEHIVTLRLKPAICPRDEIITPKHGCYNL